jgi:hypothetical protein
MSTHCIKDKSRARADSGIVAWREARLHLAGFDEGTAARLASEQAVDLHALLDLVDHGCPPRLAARILAPLEHEAGSR